MSTVLKGSGRCEGGGDVEEARGSVSTTASCGESMCRVLVDDHVMS